MSWRRRGIAGLADLYRTLEAIGDALRVEMARRDRGPMHAATPGSLHPDDGT